ncbi:glycosyltransferase [Lutibacter sp.]|uniref:glycosyltransferase n=1 Tax=Lutibacter sp. TaxID=1925666 RepID=UPI0025C527F8|nr:glycosyltransferase [Lutibacter sp.]MCF6182626.1 glycosyltransferase [Lutibacter sp.]
MKIAFVLNSFPVVSETFIVNQICSLIDCGHEITILAFNKNENEIIHNSILEYNLLDKVNYWIPEPKNKIRRLLYIIKFIFKRKEDYNYSKVIKVFNFFKYGKKALSLNYFFKNQWFLKNNKFDIIHCHFAQLGIFISQLKRDGFLMDEKLVTSFHGCDIDPSKVEDYKKNYQILFENIDLFTYNSTYSINIIRKITEVTKKFKFLPVGLDTQKFNKKKILKSASTKTEILFCGRLVPFKAPNLAIEIVKVLIDKKYNVHLTIIGEGELKQQIIDQINKYNIKNSVTMMGAVSQEDIISIMDDTDLFLMPGIEDESTGRAENQGLVIQEAQAMQLPVIVSDAGGMKYGLIENKTGFVVKQKDILGFVDKIEELIKNSKLKDSMGLEGRNFIVKNYDSKILCNKLVNYYKL